MYSGNHRFTQTLGVPKFDWKQEFQNQLRNVQLALNEHIANTKLLENRIDALLSLDSLKTKQIEKLQSEITNLTVELGREQHSPGGTEFVKAFEEEFKQSFFVTRDEIREMIEQEKLSTNTVLTDTK